MKFWYALCLILGLTSAWAQTRSVDEIALFVGDQEHKVSVIPYSRPPFAALEDLLRGLDVPVADVNTPRVTLRVNGRVVSIVRESGRLLFENQSFEFPMRERKGRRFVRVDAFANAFSAIYGRRMVYESTSRTLHLPESSDVRINVRTQKVGEAYRLTLVYSQPLRAPGIEKVGRNLIVKINADPVIWDTSGFEPNEALLSFQRYDNLPSGGSEIHFRVSEETRRYQAQPYSPDDPRSVILFTGDFNQAVEDEAEVVASRGLRRIVIDPGHGGRDHGATGPTGLAEKGVNLILAQMLSTMLVEEGGYEVALTREVDEKISLKARTAIANNFKADLFISIHVNAIGVANATGSETFYLSMDSSEAVPPHYDEVEEEEELDSELPVGDDLSLMLWDMAHTKHLEDSLRIGRYVQQELNIASGIRSRGVKQAALKVLKGAQMPAILIEAAFISNPREEEKLRDPVFKGRIARAIYTAVRRYDEDVVRRETGEDLSTQ